MVLSAGRWFGREGAAAAGDLGLHRGRGRAELLRGRTATDYVGAGPGAQSALQPGRLGASPDPSL